MKIIDNWLEGALRRESPNCGGDLVDRRFLVIHYTAGLGAAGAIDWLCDPRAKASAHLVIGRTGSLTQLVPFDLRAWHAGVSRWHEIVGLNAHSIGIELVNAGRLQRTATGAYIFPPDGTHIAPQNVVIARHKNEAADAAWQTYTKEQLEKLLEVALVLHAEYRFEDVLGHDDIAPGRKTDPGPAFPMNWFKSRLLGRQDGGIESAGHQDHA